MQFGVESGRINACRLTLIWVLFICAGCNLGSSGIAAPPSFEGPPVIKIAAPAPDETFLAGATVIVQARVENAGPDLTRISVLLDDALLGEKLNPNESNATVLPLTIDWPSSNAGEFQISVVAERGDGTIAREDVRIFVVSEEGPASAESGLRQQPDETPPASEAAAGGRRVAGTMLQPARIRLGPGATYDLVGNLDENHEVLIVAINPSREWYRISYDGQVDAWVYAEFVRPAADISGLTVETGPPLPAAAGVNLVVLDVEIMSPLVCGQESIVKARIRNAGADEAQSVAWVIADAVLMSDGSSLIENPPPAYLKTLEANEEDIIEFPLTLTTHFDEEQLIRVIVDSGNHLPETDETDNSRNSASFILQKGDCG